MIDDVFAVIADPTRRQILRVLAEGESPVGALVAELGVSQPTVSKHLKVLRTAGLVSTRAQGQRRLYSLIPEPLVAVTEWVETLTSRAGVEADAQPASSPEPAVATVSPASGESAEGANGEIIADTAVSEETAEQIADLTSSDAPEGAVDNSTAEASSSEEVIIADSAEAPEPAIQQSVISQPVIDQNRGIKPSPVVEDAHENPVSEPAESEAVESEAAEHTETTDLPANTPVFGAASDDSSDIPESAETSTDDTEDTVEEPGAEYNESTEDALQNLIASVEARLASSGDFAGREFTDFSDETEQDAHAGSDVEEAAETYEPTADDSADDTLHQIESHVVEAETSEPATDAVADVPANHETAEGTEDAVTTADVDELVTPAVETADPVDSIDAVEPENHEIAEGTETAVSETELDELIEENSGQSESAPAQHAVHFTPLTPFTPSAITSDTAETASAEDSEEVAEDAHTSVVESAQPSETDSDSAVTDAPTLAEGESAGESSETGAEFAPAPLLPSAPTESEQDEENQRGLLAVISRWGRRRR